jgi:hypothetical protein
MAFSGRGRDPDAMIGVLALCVGAIWIVGATAAAIALVGPQRLATATAVEWGAIAAAVVLPALMAWFSGLAARDSARARAEARRLADAADRLMNPERSAEDAARQLAITVRGEISTLDQALEKTLARLQEVEGQIERQARVVDDMAQQAKTGANHMIIGMEREREELTRISRDLNNQAHTISDSISRHTQAISEAARQAEAEVRAADQALDHRLTSFGAAAALISDRTHGLSSAAQASADSALRLEQALSNALDVLAKATNLTDAARQSAEAASLAANSTAGAVRETTHRAIDDAKRAAELIRGEAVSVEREAAVALERLREAANAARSAALDARAAVEDVKDQAPAPAPAPSAAPAAAPAPSPAPTAATRRARMRTPAAEPPQPEAGWRDPADTRDGAPPPRQRREITREGPMFEERQGEAERPGGDWTWRDLLSSVDDDSGRRQPAQAPQPVRREAEDPVAHLRRQISEPRTRGTLPIVEMIEQAGLDLDEVFSPSGLERIAQRARSGTQARRRAVREAAPEATGRLAQHLGHDHVANQEAMQFLRNEGMRIAELISRGRASMNAEATRVFLLIDAAAG